MAAESLKITGRRNKIKEKISEENGGQLEEKPSQKIKDEKEERRAQREKCGRGENVKNE